MKYLKNLIAEYYAFIISAALNLLAWIWIFIKIPHTNLPFIVHYNVFFGRDILGERQMLFAAPFLGLVAILINFFIFRVLKPGHDILARFSAVSTLAIQCIVLAAAWIVIWINS